MLLGADGGGAKPSSSRRVGVKPTEAEEEERAVAPGQSTQLPVVVAPAELVQVADDGQRPRRRWCSSTYGAVLADASNDDEDAGNYEDEAEG
jgi:hypothetical protein